MQNYICFIYLLKQTQRDMSTHIGVIQGLKEADTSAEKKVNTAIGLTRFYGGAENGRMMQLTLTNTDGYIQLTKKQAFELANTLLNSFDEEIYQSE